LSRKKLTDHETRATTEEVMETLPFDPSRDQLIVAVVIFIFAIRTLHFIAGRVEHFQVEMCEIS